MTMKNVSAVYVPTQPEGDGITLPTLLSLLAHGIIIGALIYGYQHTEVETVGSLETMMVSPEQLADIQGQILANRAAAQALASSQSDTAADSSATYAPSSGSDNVTTGAQRRSVFTKSDEPVYTNSQQQQIIEKMEKYERELAESKRKMSDEANQRIENRQEQRRREEEALQRQLDAYKDSYNNPQPPIEKRKAPARNSNSESDSSKTPKTHSMEDDGIPVFPDNFGQNSNQNRSPLSGGGGGASDAQILGEIRKKFNPPAGKTGSVQLIITVDASGRVIDAKSPGEDTVFSREAVRAAKAVGRFDIDSSHPQYPNIPITFNGSR